MTCPVIKADGRLLRTIHFFPWFFLKKNHTVHFSFLTTCLSYVLYIIYIYFFFYNLGENLHFYFGSSFLPLFGMKSLISDKYMTWIFFYFFLWRKWRFRINEHRASCHQFKKKNKKKIYILLVVCGKSRLLKGSTFHCLHWFLPGNVVG